MTSPSVEHEISEQPAILERLLARPGWSELAGRVAARGEHGVVTIARGSSDHAASYLAYLVWTRLGRPAASLPPSVATLGGGTLRLAGRAAFGISQSGESPNVVRGLEAARAGGAGAIALTNVAGSALAKVADETVELDCGPERAVAATKTFTASLAALAAIGLRWAARDDLVAELARVPELASRAAKAKLPAAAVDALAESAQAIVLGRGFTLPLASELALKLKEMARVPAEALSTHEFLHGPLGALEPGTPVIVVVPGEGPVRASCDAVVAKLAERGAKLVLLEGERGVSDEVAAIPLAITLQRLAVAVARARGADPDKPRNIEKVTKTW